MKKGKLTPVVAAALLVFTSSIACAGNYAVTVKMKGQALTGEFVYQADLTLSGALAGGGCNQTVTSIGPITSPASFWVNFAATGKCKFSGAANLQPQADSDQFTLYNNRYQMLGTGTQVAN
jgi:hypothetical protein